MIIRIFMAGIDSHNVSLKQPEIAGYGETAVASAAFDELVLLFLHLAHF